MDVVKTEQLNLSIRWANDAYEANEGPVGLYRVPNTKTDTLSVIIKDLLIQCKVPLALCRGQAYDGATNMQGRITGVSATILTEEPAASGGSKHLAGEQMCRENSDFIFAAFFFVFF